MPILVGGPGGGGQAAAPGVLAVPNIRPVGSPLGEVVVDLDGFQIGVVHPSGANVHLGAIGGWYAPATSSLSVTQRTASDGGWLGDANRTAREIELTVHIDGGTWDVATLVLDQLVSHIPVTELARMRVTDGDLELIADVQQISEVVVARNAGRATVSIALVAPDPRRYSNDLVTLSTGLPTVSGGLRLPLRAPLSVGAVYDSGRLTAQNDGNTDTSPLMVVSGPCPAWSITHLATGKRLYGTAIDVGRTLVLDFASRTARLDGTALRVVAGTWFDLGPGDNEIAFSAVAYNSEARLDVLFRSARR